MTKVVKAFALSIVLIALVLAPACRSKKAPPKPIVAPTDTTASVPPVPVTTTETRVANPPDFVQPAPPSVSVENLPSDLEELNRVAEQRGFLQDAFFGYDEAAWAKNRRAHLVIVGK